MRLRHVLSLALAATTAGFTGLSATPAETTRKVRSRVRFQAGAVTDLTAEDLTVKVKAAKTSDRQPRAGNRPGTDVVMLVDDGGTGKAHQPASCSFSRLPR